MHRDPASATVFVPIVPLTFQRTGPIAMLNISPPLHGHPRFGTSPLPSAPEHSLADSIRSTLRRLAPTPKPRQYAFHHERVLGTSCEIQVVAARPDIARHAESVVLTEIDRLSAILNGRSRISELTRWLSHHGTAVPVSPELAEVLERAEAWRVTTTGAFNPAAASLVELLRDAVPSDPLDQRLDDAARERAVCLRLRALHDPLWAVDRTKGTATRLTRLAVSLDAIAKGYIVERAAALASDIDGVSQLLVNVGGDLRHVGDRALNVGVTDPSSPAENSLPIALIRLRNAGMATSGGYRRGFVSNGQHVSHIIDPRAGTPVARIASASVFSPDCSTADALSTAFSVMAPHESIALADSIPGVGCLLVEQDGSMTSNDTWDAAATWPSERVDLPTMSRSN